MAAVGEEEELLVFGYACKLFRDNERAMQVENGDFLVPWMGDSSVLLDRFDARGVLSNVKNHEAVGDLKREEYMSPEEVMTEEMCDDERYR